MTKKQKNQKRTMLQLIFVFSSLLFMGCGLNSLRVSPQNAESVTSVGNPQAEQPTKNFASNICKKLSSCNSDLTANECESKLGLVSGLSESLGVPENTFLTYNDLIAAESKQLVQANRARLDLCAAEISKLSCKSQEIKNAYNPSGTVPFLGVPALVNSQNASCSNSISCVGDCGVPQPSPTPPTAQCEVTGSTVGQVPICSNGQILVGGNVASRNCCSGTWSNICFADASCNSGQSCVTMCN